MNQYVVNDKKCLQNEVTEENSLVQCRAIGGTPVVRVDFACRWMFEEFLRMHTEYYAYYGSQRGVNVHQRTEHPSVICRRNGSPVNIKYKRSNLPGQWKRISFEENPKESGDIGDIYSNIALSNSECKTIYSNITYIYCVHPYMLKNVV